MARVHYVEKAQKDNPAVKAGQPYYWWQFRFGPKRYSATAPRPSQLTQSRWGDVLAAEEAFLDAIAAAGSHDDLEAAVDEAASSMEDIAGEFESSADSMPESLQDSETAERIRERASALQDAASEFASFDWTDPEDAREECDTDETPEEAAFRIDQARVESELAFPDDPY